MSHTCLSRPVFLTPKWSVLRRGTYRTATTLANLTFDTPTPGRKRMVICLKSILKIGVSFIP